LTGSLNSSFFAGEAADSSSGLVLAAVGGFFCEDVLGWPFFAEALSGVATALASAS